MKNNEYFPTCLYNYYKISSKKLSEYIYYDVDDYTLFMVNYQKPEKEILWKSYLQFFNSSASYAYITYICKINLKNSLLKIYNTIEAFFVFECKWLKNNLAIKHFLDF